MGEYIERKAVMDIILRTSGDYAAAFSEAKSYPAADVEPVKHGHWTEKKISGGGIWDYYFVCSECHHETPNRGYTIAPDYCSGCGAKMDGEKCTY